MSYSQTHTGAHNWTDISIRLSGGVDLKFEEREKLKLKKSSWIKYAKLQSDRNILLDPALHPLFPAAVLSHNATLCSPMQGRSQDSKDTEVLPPPHPHPYIETTLKTVVYIISISLHFDRKIDR